VWDLGGFIGSTSWGLWVAALGVTVLLRPAHAGHIAAGSSVDIGSIAPSPRLPAGAGVRS
jgi:hypothetical protein